MLKLLNMNIPCFFFPAEKPYNAEIVLHKSRYYKLELTRYVEVSCLLRQGFWRWQDWGGTVLTIGLVHWWIYTWLCNKSWVLVGHMSLRATSGRVHSCSANAPHSLLPGCHGFNRSLFSCPSECLFCLGTTMDQILQTPDPK